MLPEPEETQDDGSSPDEGEDDDYAMAGNAILDAIKGGDGAALAEALCHLQDIHSGEGDDEEPEPASGKRPDLAVLLAKKPK